MNRSTAEIVREYGPFPGIDVIHGVSYDGQRVWFATGPSLAVLEPESGRLLRSIEATADAGTAFDGRHLFQIAGDRIRKIDPETGEVLATIAAPTAGSSGLAWAEGSLWVGGYRERKIHQVDPETGEVRERLDMPAGIGVSGLESDGNGRFFCGGGPSGKLRVVRRPGSAAR